MVLPIYSKSPPILVIDELHIKYEDDHIKHFCYTTYYQNFINLSQTEREEWFQLQKDYANIIDKIYGEKLYKNAPFLVLDKSGRENINDEFVKEYSDWLKK
jgi:hypothetical protein